MMDNLFMFLLILSIVMIFLCLEILFYQGERVKALELKLRQLQNTVNALWNDANLPRDVSLPKE